MDVSSIALYKILACSDRNGRLGWEGGLRRGANRANVLAVGIGRPYLWEFGAFGGPRALMESESHSSQLSCGSELRILMKDKSSLTLARLREVSIKPPLHLRYLCNWPNLRS